MTSLVVVIFGLLLGMFGQGVVFYLAFKRLLTAGESERRYLSSLAFADTPQDVVGLMAAARPDETVVAVAEARAQAPRSSTPSPLGL